MILAGLTDKPVVVVPPGSRPPEHLRTVVVAMEGTPGKARALQRSIEISSRAGLEIVVVHVHDEDSVPSFSDQVQHETVAYAQEFFSRHLIGAPQMRLELRLGIPAIEILDAIESAHAELVAVGWPRSEDPRRGAVAKEILERSPVAVLLVAIA
jgi:nucleotide-binding universal stress UspA family protein